MPVQAIETARTITQSIPPVYGKKKPQFVFWDALQISNATREFCDLVYEKHLGEGANFVVDLYHDPVTVNHLVSVKTAKPRSSSVNLYSFSLETQVLECLKSHPNIINQLGMDWTIGVDEIPAPRLVVEYAVHGTLSAFLQTRPSLNINEKAELCLDVASGLWMIHKCQLVHGDIKLANILVFEDENFSRPVAKIADFGSTIAALDADGAQEYHGTRFYLAPELNGNPALAFEDLQKCDIFAFGLCVWEILNNGYPYFAQSDKDLIHFNMTRPLSEAFDKFLETISFEDALWTTGSEFHVMPQTEPDKAHFSGTPAVRDIFHELVHRSIHSIPSQRYKIGEITDILEKVTKPRVNEFQGPIFPFRSVSVGIWGFSIQNRVPRDAQRQAVLNLKTSMDLLGVEDKCRAKLMLSDCYAHGYGVPTDFHEALSSYKQAAQAGSLSAEITYMRISSAILSCGEENVRNKSDSFTRPPKIRRAVQEIEDKLSSVKGAQNLAARLRQWSRLEREEEEKHGFLVTYDDGEVQTIEPTTVSNVSHFLSSGPIKNIGTAIVTSRGELVPNGVVKSLLLHTIATKGWTDMLKSLTKDTDLLFQVLPDSNQFGDISNPGSLLMAAALYGQAQTVRYLLEMGVPASRWGGLDSFPSRANGLHFLWAFEDQDVDEMARILVQHGADPNMTGDYSSSVNLLAPEFSLVMGDPPLDLAVWLGDIRAVKALLKYGANPLQRVEEFTAEKLEHDPLELAVALHLYDIVDVILGHLNSEGILDRLEPQKRKRLLAHVSGFILGSKGMFRRWLLHGEEYRRACSKTIETVLKYGLPLDPSDNNGATPVLIAACANPCQNYVLEALLQHGADPDARNIEGIVPLSQYCCRTVWDSVDNARTVRTLLKYGAGVNLAADNGQTPLHYHAGENSFDGLKILIARGASLEAREKRGMTPLFFAAGADSVESLGILLDEGADIEATAPVGNPYKLTPLGWAVLNGKSKAARALLNRGASIIQKEIPATVLHVAGWYGQIQVMRVMMQEYGTLFCKPSVLNSLDNRQQSPFHGAVLRSPHCIDLLLQAGTDIDFRTTEKITSRTALAIPIENENLERAIYLLEKGASVFCRGPKQDQLWSFLNEYVYQCGRKRSLRSRMPQFLLDSKQWIDQHKLLNVRDYAGQTILHFAVRHGQLDAIKALVACGASLEDRIHEPRFPSWEQDGDLWKHYHVENLDALNFAKVLRKSTPKQRRSWVALIPYEITNEDMDSIIQFLGTRNI